MSELLKHLSKGARKTVYLATILLGLVIGALNVAYLAATGDIPLALSVVNAVALFLGVPVSAGTARANIQPAPNVTVALDPASDDVEFENPDSIQFEREDM